MRRAAPSKALTKGEISGLILDYLNWLNTPRALAVWLCYKYDMHYQILEFNCDPHSYADAESFKRDFAATKLLSKCTFLNVNIDKKGVAIEASAKAEHQNRETNQRFRSQDIPGGVDILSIRRKVAEVLGEVPDPNELLCSNWSTGRTIEVSGLYVGANKFAAADVSLSSLAFAYREVNGDCLEFGSNWARALLEAEGPVWVLPRAFNVVNHNVMITVPKNSKTDRPICYEPTLNVWLQRKVGVYIASRLKRKANIDLKHGWKSNAVSAREGSKSGRFSTIDLSAASDTLAHNVVLELVPPDWFSLLNKLRSTHTKWPDGQIRENEKFSSMGNGFTFELETLIFWAICSVASQSRVLAYGDDLVVEGSSFEKCVEWLSVFGFTTNKAKSYNSSYFRESCGGNYFQGVDVTPPYLKEFKTHGDLLKFHNSVVRRFGQIPVTWKWRQKFPNFLGRESYGDGFYHVEDDELMTSPVVHWAGKSRSYVGLDGFWTRAWVFKPKILSRSIATWQCDAASGTLNPSSPSSSRMTRNGSWVERKMFLPNSSAKLPSWVLDIAPA